MTLPNQKKIPAPVMKGREKETARLIESWRHRWQQCYHLNMPMLMFVNCSQTFGPIKCCAFHDYLDPANRPVYHKFGVAYGRNDESENNRAKIGFVCRSCICQFLYEKCTMNSIIDFSIILGFKMFFSKRMDLTRQVKQKNELNDGIKGIWHCHMGPIQHPIK